MLALAAGWITVANMNNQSKPSRHTTSTSIHTFFFFLKTFLAAIPVPLFNISWSLYNDFSFVLPSAWFSFIWLGAYDVCKKLVSIFMSAHYLMMLYCDYIRQCENFNEKGFKLRIAIGVQTMYTQPGTDSLVGRDRNTFGQDFHDALYLLEKKNQVLNPSRNSISRLVCEIMYFHLTNTLRPDGSFRMNEFFPRHYAKKCSS